MFLPDGGPYVSGVTLFGDSNSISERCTSPALSLAWLREMRTAIE